MRIALVVASALALAAPAAFADAQPPQALSPPVVAGAGLTGIAGVRAARYRHVHAAGITAAGTFRIDFAAGPGRKLVLVHHGAPVFRALRFTSMRWAARSVSISGIGLAGGVRVHFVALAVDGARDVFRIDWLHRATLGGVLSHGAVVIH
jgi:opacity protein-like surface antigen